VKECYAAVRKSAVFYEVGNRIYKGLFLICVAFLAVGTLMGLVSASFAENTSQVTEYSSLNVLFGYINSDGVGIKAFINSFISASILCLAVFILTFFVFGYIFIPLVSMIKGFLLSFFSASILTIYGNSGIWISIVYCSLDIFICIPCLLAFSAYCMRTSSKLTQVVFSGSCAKPFTGSFFLVSLFTLSVLFFTSILKSYLIPQIIALLI